MEPKNQPPQALSAASRPVSLLHGRSENRSDSTVPKRRRGRPPGQRTQLLALTLRHPHFSFLRALVEDLDLTWAWRQYLAFEGGPDDERHFRARARELVKIVRVGAASRGLDDHAVRAFSGLDLRARHPGLRAAPSTSALPSTAPQPSLASPPPVAHPSLEDWIEERCAGGDLDPDFYSRAEWLELYEDEFPAATATPSVPVPMPATALEEPPSPPPTRSGVAARPDPKAPKPVGTLAERVDALNALAFELSKPPALADTLSSWLSTELAACLAGAQMRGKPMPLLTIENLAAFVGLLGNRWWTHVPGLGELRARRLLEWLVPLAQQLGQPIRAEALHPARVTLQLREQALARIDPESTRRYGIVTLDRLLVLPAIDGRVGTFRSPNPNTLGASTDLEAILKWLARYEKKPRTLEQYQRALERFYLWSVTLKKKPLGSLVEEDFRDFAAFLKRPPIEWVQLRRVDRRSDHWRPFNSTGLGETSVRHNFTIVSAFLSDMVEAGYLTAQAAAGVKPSLKLRQVRIDIDRSFSAAQWTWIMQTWQARYAVAGPARQRLDGSIEGLLPSDGNPDRSPLKAAVLRRTRLILELGATTGMRLIELATTRKKDIQRLMVDGQSLWLISVLGKGDKPREAILYDDIKQLLDQHHRDMERAGTQLVPAAKRRLRTLNNPEASPPSPAPSADSGPSLAILTTPTAGAVAFDEGLRPLIGSLHPGIKHRRISDLGILELASQESALSDVQGSLDPNALYQSLKRFLKGCADRADDLGAEIDTEALRRSSTHWLRHFFANNAVEDGVEVKALMGAMGHSSLTTTSVYLRSERKELVREIGKMHRR